ncbi:MAG TPA: hypothetical protein VF518_07030 [Polyangia bacterium]
MRRRDVVHQPAVVFVFLCASLGWGPLVQAQIPEPTAPPYPVLDDPQPAPHQPDSTVPPGPQATPGPVPEVQTGAAPETRSRFSVGATLAVTSQSETHSSQTATAPVLQGRAWFTPQISADLDWGFAVLLDSESPATFRSGNPWLKGWYRGEHGKLRWQAGIGVSLPLASVNLGADGRLQLDLYNQTAAAWGLWDRWRWAPGRLAVPIPANLWYDLSSGMQLTAEIAIAPVVGVNNGASGTDLLAQLAVGFRLLLIHDLWICPRLQTVLLPASSVDRLQTAAGLRVEWAPSLGRFFLGALVNLDEPVGVFGRGPHSWGIHLGKELD